jgi:hypothetical protein
MVCGRPLRDPPESLRISDFFVEEGVLNVVAVMSGHLGTAADNEILPKWDPNRANLALDVEKIISSDCDFLRLIETDIGRFHQPNPARVLIGRRPPH